LTIERHILNDVHELTRRDLNRELGRNRTGALNPSQLKVLLVLVSTKKEIMIKAKGRRLILTIAFFKLTIVFLNVIVLPY
jgi:hypothetical protein